MDRSNLAKYYPSLHKILSNYHRFNQMISILPSEVYTNLYDIVGDFNILAYHSISVVAFEIYFLEIYNLIFRFNMDNKLSNNIKNLINQQIKTDVNELEKRMGKMITSIRNIEVLSLKTKGLNDEITMRQIEEEKGRRMNTETSQQR